MAQQTLIPFGPQHPVLPEPIQLRLVLEDEIVVSAIPIIGYIHRGLEKLVEQKDFQQNPFLLERICGICSFIHSMNYCQGIEKLMGLEVSPRAKYLRVFWSELNRLHSHLLWVGLLADSFGYENLFMWAWRAREKVQDLAEFTSGGRVMYGTCSVGGVRRDLSPDQVRHVLSEMDQLKDQLDKLVPAILNDYTVQQRLVGVGAISREVAFERGGVGPIARATGIRYDHRTTGYAAYGDLQFEPIVETAGDCYARTQVRMRELYQSIDLIKQVFSKLPEGPLQVPVKGNPDGETVTRVEQPRGEVLYYFKANGTKNLDRLRVRTPTFANAAALLAMLPGCELADVPVIVLSIDPCISCTER
jgi:Ni,Fe-hydrogenase III large subunit